MKKFDLKEIFILFKDDGINYYLGDNFKELDGIINKFFKNYFLINLEDLINLLNEFKKILNNNSDNKFIIKIDSYEKNNVENEEYSIIDKEIFIINYLYSTENSTEKSNITKNIFVKCYSKIEAIKYFNDNYKNMISIFSIKEIDILIEKILLFHKKQDYNFIKNDFRKKGLTQNELFLNKNNIIDDIIDDDITDEKIISDTEKIQMDLLLENLKNLKVSDIEE